MAQRWRILRVLGRSAETHALGDQLGHSNCPVKKYIRMRIFNCRFESNGDDIKGKTVLVLCHMLCASHQVEETALNSKLSSFHLITVPTFLAATLYSLSLITRLVPAFVKTSQRFPATRASRLVNDTLVSRHASILRPKYPFRLLSCIFISL